MSENSGKILLLNYDSETTAHVTNAFSGRCDVTTADDLNGVIEKAGDDFDVVITGYAVPAVSGDKAISYLQDIQKAFDEAQSALREKTDANEALLKKRGQEQSKILDFLNDQVRQAERERAELKQEMQTMVEKEETYLQEKIEAEEKAEDALKARAEAEEKADVALKVRADAEEKAEAALKDRSEAEEKADAALKARAEAEAEAEEALTARAEAEAEAEEARSEKTRAEEGIAKLREKDAARVEKLNSDVNRLQDELENAVSLAEEGRAEKAKIEEKLARLQENWQNFVEGA
jgi:chromosome segregation ATPase